MNPPQSAPIAAVHRDSPAIPPSSASHGTASSATLAKMPSPCPQEKEALRLTLLQRLDEVCLKLPPAFFSINMGTGITSILLYNLPYNAHWLRMLGTIIFVLNVAIFAVLCLANLVRYTRYRGLFTAVANHLAAGMFWGCLPMGMATIVVSTQFNHHDE